MSRQRAVQIEKGPKVALVAESSLGVYLARGWRRRTEAGAGASAVQGEGGPSVPPASVPSASTPARVEPDVVEDAVEDSAEQAEPAEAAQDDVRDSGDWERGADVPGERIEE